MAFNIPINSIAPVVTPADWVRPADWITITDTANEVQFLVADTALKAFSIQTTFTKNSGTNIYIDWGDGVVDTVNTATTFTTNHVYSTGGTPCSRGYNTFKIRIYGDATCVISSVRHLPNFAVTGGNPFYPIGLLEAYFGDGTVNGLTFGTFSSIGATSSVATFTELEYVKLPSTVTWTNTFSNMFSSCTNLYKVVMPISASSVTTLSSTFSNCANLRSIIIPTNATGITTMVGAFSSCRSLTTISFPSTLNSCTVLSATFSGCSSLINATLPSINLCTDLGNAFGSCTALQWVRFTSLPTPVSPATSISLSSTFSSCPNLQNVYFPSTCSTNGTYNTTSTFASCTSLKNIILPVNFNSSTLNSTFSGCSNLTNVTIQSPMPSLVSMNNTFNGCVLLTSVTLPATVGTSITLSGAFTGCQGLPSITIPSGWILTSLNNTFQTCFNLKTVVLPNNTQNSLTTMNSTFTQCYKLESVIMPTVLNNLTTLTSAFSLCTSLTSIALPSSMNALTSLSGTFSNCPNLTSITLPTSTTALNNILTAFQNCNSIETITLPATTGTILNFTSTFSGCTNLKTITLPSITQMSSVNNLQNMLFQCGALTTINYLDKVGSLTATPLVNAAFVESLTYTLTSLEFSCPFSILTVNGLSSTAFNKLNSLRLLNTGAGQWTGLSPQIDVSYCDLSAAALNQLFTDLTTITTKTINITGCTGAATCNRSIATAKGWTVTG